MGMFHLLGGEFGWLKPHQEWQLSHGHCLINDLDLLRMNAGRK